MKTKKEIYLKTIERLETYPDCYDYFLTAKCSVGTLVQVALDLGIEDIENKLAESNLGYSTNWSWIVSIYKPSIFLAPINYLLNDLYELGFTRDEIVDLEFKNTRESCILYLKELVNGIS